MRRILTLAGTAVLFVVIGSNEIARAGIDGGGAPKTAKGTVTQFGSVYVNGVRYDTDFAMFLIDGEVGRESDLRVGQIVTVIGSADADAGSGTAYLVIYEDIVEGPVAEVVPEQNRLTILGQTVYITADTSFSVAGVDSLHDVNINEHLEVSGYTDSEGAVVATHIAASDSGDFDIKAVVSDIDFGNLRLTIAELDVDFSSAFLLGFSDGTPSVGDRVAILGSHMNASGAFVASRVEYAPQAIAAYEGDGVELEGLITRYSAPWNFDVDGIRVTIHWTTRFDGGWLFDLGQDVKVEVEGRLDNHGRLRADRIEFEPASTNEISGFVESIGSDVVVVEGHSIRVTAETEYEDVSDDDDQRFGIEDLRTSDFLHIRYYDGNGDVLATRIERRADDDDDDGEDD